MLDLYSNADYIGQAKALEIFKQLFSGCTVQYEQHYSDKSPIDIYVTATTKNGKVSTYAVECKDRNFSIDRYDDMMIERHKYNSIKSVSGYKPIYFNTFTDGYAVWNLQNTPYEERNVNCGKSTVEDKGKIDKVCYFLNKKDCIASGKTN